MCNMFIFSPQAANEEALKRKNGLADNLEAWKNFEEKRMDGALIVSYPTR